jgi:hypothetical protein
MLQAKVHEVVYLHEWAHPDPDKQAEYMRLQSAFPGGIRRLEIDDPNADWAVSSRASRQAETTDETGHRAP